MISVSNVSTRSGHGWHGWHLGNVQVINQTLARLLRQCLKQQGLSGYRLAQRSGRSQASISRLIRGKGGASVQMIQDLARALGVPEETLLQAAGLLRTARTPGQGALPPFPQMGGDAIVTQVPAVPMVPVAELLLLSRQIRQFRLRDKQLKRLDALDQAFILKQLRSVVTQLQTVASICRIAGS